MKNIEQELKKNVRWIARKSGKTNKQVMDDIKKLEQMFFWDNKKVKNK
jgi:hypothetical protein